MSLLDERMSQRTVERAQVAAWTEQLGSPMPESDRTRLSARIGGLAAIVALLAYLTWRISFTFPTGGTNLALAWLLVTFEALPLIGLVLKAATLWSIDGRSPAPVNEAPNWSRSSAEPAMHGESCVTSVAGLLLDRRSTTAPAPG